MAADKTKTRPQDAKVTADQLKAAVKTVGKLAEAVEKHLNGAKLAASLRGAPTKTLNPYA